MFSIQKNNYTISKLLLENGSDVNHKDIDGFSPLMIAIDSNDFNLIKLLLEYRPIIEVIVYNLESF